MFAHAADAGRRRGKLYRGADVGVGMGMGSGGVCARACGWPRWAGGRVAMCCFAAVPARDFVYGFGGTTVCGAGCRGHCIKGRAPMMKQNARLPIAGLCRAWQPRARGVDGRVLVRPPTHTQHAFRRPADGGQAMLLPSVLHPSPAACWVEGAYAPCSANLARAKLAAALIAAGCWLCWWDLSYQGLNEA